MRTPTYRPQRHSSKQASARGAWARLHSLRLDNSQCIRPPQELEQLSSCVGHSRVRAYGASKRDVGLDLGRERSYQLDARRRHNLRDDYHPKLDLAFGHKLRDDVGI